MKAACVQLCCGTDVAVNIEAAETLIRAAHKDGAVFIATPENTNLMHSSTHELFEKISDEEKCKTLQHFKALARELEIDLLIGSLAVRYSDHKAANRSFLIGKDGQIKSQYDKMHLFDVDINETETWRESDNYVAGKTPILTSVGDMGVGLSICYDLRFASLYKHYAKSGAHVLSVPAAFTTVTGAAHWRVLLRARAIET
ncbi:MAG: carbon-nitrogen hydrolase family protein, partial [Robiginitomaculum sp.]|nr:carbon-nitrogen hydrolase family protein [Robiginitomaculum sp.]